MKNLFALLLVIFFLGGGESIKAQMRDRDPEAMLKRELDGLKEALILSEEQVKEVVPILTGANDKRSSLFSDENMDFEKMREEMEKLTDATDEKLKEILTNEQVKKLAEYREHNKRPRREIKWVNPDIKEMSGLTHHILISAALGHDVGYAVWTPPGYNDSKKKYPVIYFLHGAGGNESADAAGFSGWALKAIEDGLLPPVICVFPNGGMSGYRGTVEKMIIEELIPLIEKEYRTKARPSSRAVAGFSMGGAGSVSLAIKHPELFCAAASMGGGVRSGGEAVKAALPVWKKNKFGLFAANGDNDRPDAFKEFAVTLEENGIDYEVMVLPDTHHNLGLYYERSVSKLLAFLGKHIKK